MRTTLFCGNTAGESKVKIVYDDWNEKYIVFRFGIVVEDGFASKSWKEISETSSYENARQIAEEA